MTIAQPLNPYEAPAEPQPLPRQMSDRELTFAGSMTMEEANQFEHLIPGPKRRSVSKFDWLILTGALVCVCGWTVWEVIVYGEIDFALESVLGVVTIGGFMFALWFMERQRKQAVQKCYEEKTGAFTNIAGERTPNGVRFLAADYPVDYDWQDFAGYRAAEDVVALYVQYPTQYNFVAASYFEHRCDWEQFKEEVQEQLAPISKMAFRKSSSQKMSHVVEGIDHLNHERWTASITAFNRALEINPNEAQALRGRGLAHLHNQDVLAASADFDRVIESMEEPDMLTRRLRSATLLATEQYERALEDLEMLSEHFPKDPDVLRDFGLALQKLGQLDAAEQNYNRAIQLNDQDGLAYNNRGATLIELGRLEEAIADLERAIELVPDVPNPYKHLDRAREMLNEQSETTLS